MEPTLVLIIRNDAKQGESILGNSWLPFIEHLRAELRNQGVEHSLSTDTSLVFTFAGHYTPFSALFSALTKSKQTYQWPDASGTTPLKFIIDLLGDETPLNESGLPDAGIWDKIQPETVYLGATLQEQWQDFASQQNFPDHKLGPKSDGLVKITFSIHDLGKQKTLFAYRSLPVSQKGRECFYCGMASHHPAQCPSKMLGMDSWGLSDIGYLSFSELNGVYKKVFPEKPEIVARLSGGVKTMNLRKDKELLVFVSFFDLSVIFQLRFLWNYAFSAYSKWETIYQTNKVKIDNRNLHMGLDCLRVGQYDQAEEMLQNEIKRRDGNKFAANIGLALLSLESDRNSDVGRYFEAARNNTKTTTEIIYANLILSRHFEIIKDFWSAKEAVTNALKADYDCLDVQYRRVQLSIRENNMDSKELKQLRSMILGQKDIFIRALLDPSLISAQGLLNETLSKQFNTISFDADHNLQEAKKEVQGLAMWLKPEDKRKTENHKSIESLQEQIGKKSYFHKLDVSEKSNGLFFTCRRLRKALADQLNDELTRYHRQLDGYHKFWKRYPYKRFDKNFYPSAIQTLNQCRKAVKLLKENTSGATKEAISLAHQIKTGYATTKKEYARLLLIRTVMNGVRIFIKKFLICEGAGLLIMLLLFPAINATLGDTPSMDWLIQLTTSSGFQKKSILLTSLFMAPFIALAWTLIDLQRE